MKKLYLIAALILSSASIAKAQMPEHPQYVKYWDKNDKFVEFYKTWEPGRAMSSMPDDEEFFISRVKPRRRFEDRNTQVDQSLSNERKFLWWVPIGVSKWNAIPSYYFNSEVFSTWSYIDHWGNWTAPYMRMPAAFADVAHKNGVSISATATMGFGAHLRANDNDGYGGKMYTVANQGEEKYIKYLQYYGFDGNGYNSEARFDPALNHSYKNLLSKASAKAKEKDLFNYSNVWYGITDNNGTMATPWDALDFKHQD